MVGHLGRPRRLLAAPVVAVVLLVAAAAPASAHTLSGPQPSNYRTTVVGVVPAVPGVEVTVVDGGTKLQLTNRTAETVIVEGYEGEPYLRVGPDGVSENLNSAATYLNRSLRGGVVPPGVDVSPDAPPDWRRISGGDTARWHDHRAHWMGEGLPPVVAADPGAPHRISTGRIPLTVGSARSEVVVNVDWVPGPDAWPWVALALVLGIVGCAVVASPRGRRAAAGLVAVLVVVDATHAVSYALARPGSSVEAVVRILTGSFASVAVWIVAVPTVVALARGRSGGYYGAVLVGLMVALAGGMTDLDSLSRSQIPTSGPEVLSRVEVAVAIGLGFGTAIGAVVALLRGRTRRHEVPAAAGRVAALVAGLDDRELRRIAAGLDAAETLASLVPEFAGRCAADSATLAAAPVRLEVVAADAVDPHVWTIAVRDGVVAAAPGPGDGGEAACVRVSFPTFLRLVGGVTTLTAAVDAGRAETTGPPAVIETVGRRLPEAAAPPADPPVR